MAFGIGKKDKDEEQNQDAAVKQEDIQNVVSSEIKESVQSPEESKDPETETVLENNVVKDVEVNGEGTDSTTGYDNVVDNLVEGGVDTNIGDLLEKIVSEAIVNKSSDIHIEPREKDVVIRYRVDGLLREVMTLEKKLEQALIFKIKVSARLRTDEHFAPQDGKIQFPMGDKKLDARISIMPTTKGEKVVMRLLSQEGKSFALEDLGLTDNELANVQKAYNKPHGMIIAAGPTGSGKTTTLYSILKILNDPEINITTIEDPVEYDIPGVNHIQINPKANLTFAGGLRSVLRQDPDVIMIGEIRDGETARIATNSAMTGHLVLSTIHTNDAVTTIPRLLDMGIEEFLVASTLNVVIAQRLARRLCESCKKKTSATKASIAEIAQKRPDIAALLAVGDEYFVAGACKECGETGHRGRVGLYEVLQVDKAIREMIHQKATSDQIFEVARKGGMVLILEDGIKKLKAGIISVEEIMRVTALKEE